MSPCTRCRLLETVLRMIALAPGIPYVYASLALLVLDASDIRIQEMFNRLTERTP